MRLVAEADNVPRLYRECFVRVLVSSRRERDEQGGMTCDVRASREPFPAGQLNGMRYLA
jgi:hypothetical protein